MAGGVAVTVPALPPKLSFKERKARIEDAVRNAKAAVEEGIVAGGGGLYEAAQQAFTTLNLEGDEATGARSSGWR